MCRINSFGVFLMFIPALIALSLLQTTVFITCNFRFKVYSEGIFKNEVIEAQGFRTICFLPSYLLAINRLDGVIYIAIWQEN